MKKITIALFAIMLTAGFAMGQTNVDVNVIVDGYYSATVPTTLTIAATGAPSVYSADYTVTVDSNVDGTITYDLTGLTAATGMSFNTSVWALDNFAAGLTAQSFVNTLEITTTYALVAGNHDLGDISVTLAQ